MDNTIHIIDLHFLQEKHAIGAFLINSPKGLVLIETGPETTFDYLCEGIGSVGYNWKDVKHVFLTHIHFDHAGAAWKFAAEGALVYVHPTGLPHLENPERLWNSAAQIYGEDMDRLWGNMQPIDRKQLVSTDDGARFNFVDFEIEAIYTPGHAIHHNAYRMGDIVFTGDVAGVKIGDGPVVPPCPPPDINIELWKKSLDKLRAVNPRILYLTHFAKHEDPFLLFNDLELMLDNWSRYIKVFYDKEIPIEQIIPEFKEYTYSQLREKGVTEEEIQVYEYANPSWMSVSGLMRYWKLKEQKRL